MVESGLLEVLRGIEGSTFLWIFLLAGIAALLGARAWMRHDDTAKKPSPSYLNQDPLMLAYLSGRENGVKRAMLFRLFSESKLGLDHDKTNITALASEESNATKDSLEHRIIAFFRSSRSLHDYFLDSSLDYYVGKYSEPFVSRLRDEGLLMGPRQVWIARSKIIVIAILLMTFGGTKLYLGLKYDRPVTFLVLLMIMFVLVFIILAFRPRLTTLGRRYLKESQDHLAWAKISAEKGDLPQGIDPALVVALFGAIALLPVADFHDLSSKMGVNGSGAAGCGYSGGGGCGGAGGCGGGCGCGGGGCGGCGGS